MADFEKAYILIRQSEGNYANVPGDPGGMTYGGIARNIFPWWAGWTYVDQFRMEHGEPKHNQKIGSVESHVYNFFRELWFKNRFDEIASQQVANIYFDWFVNTISNYAKTGRSVPVKHVQSIVGAKVDGIQGPETINKINAYRPQSELIGTIYKAREAFYNTLVLNDPTLSKFLKGWTNRLQLFATDIGTSGRIAVILILILILFL